MLRGKKVSESKAKHISGQLKSLLPQDEKIQGIFEGVTDKPGVEYIIITDARVICAGLRIVGEGYKFINEIHAEDISHGTKIKNELWRGKIFLLEKSGEKRFYINVRKDEAAEISQLMNGVVGSPKSLESVYGKEKSEISKIITESKKALPGIINEIKQSYDKWSKDKWRVITTGEVNQATLKEIKNSCHPGEHPEFIIGTKGATGALVAFSDRCIIIKKGVVTSFFAGSLGGGRVTTFYYKDITGIEFNSGILTGALEVLTPSYSGETTKNNRAKKRDTDIFKLSNTLPMDRFFYKKVRPQIEWLKQRVGESKGGHTTKVQSSNDISSQIEKLSSLNKAGVLSDDEFSKAKKSLLEKL